MFQAQAPQDTLTKISSVPHNKNRDLLSTPDQHVHYKLGKGQSNKLWSSTILCEKNHNGFGNFSRHSLSYPQMICQNKFWHWWDGRHPLLPNTFPGKNRTYGNTACPSEDINKTGQTWTGKHHHKVSDIYHRSDKAKVTILATNNKNDSNWITYNATYYTRIENAPYFCIWKFFQLWQWQQIWCDSFRQNLHASMYKNHTPSASGKSTNPATENIGKRRESRCSDIRHRNCT